MEELRCLKCGESDCLRVLIPSAIAERSSCDEQHTLSEVTTQIEALQRLKLVMLAAMPATVPAVPKEPKPVEPVVRICP